MEPVFKSIGGMDDVYRVTQVSGAPLRRLGRQVADASAPTQVSTRDFTLDEGRQAARTAVANAATILATLDSIRSKVEIADGLATPSVRGDASRFSLQSDIDALVASIDLTVARSAAGGINLLARPETAFRVQTSPYGGTAPVFSQAFDSVGLGIDALDVRTQAATESSKVRINAAVREAATRYEALNQAVQGLAYDGAFSDTLVRALQAVGGGVSSPGLARGSLVDLSA